MAYIACLAFLFGFDNRAGSSIAAVLGAAAYGDMEGDEGEGVEEADISRIGQSGGPQISHRLTKNSEESEVKRHGPQTMIWWCVSDFNRSLALVPLTAMEYIPRGWIVCTVGKEMAWYQVFAHATAWCLDVIM